MVNYERTIKQLEWLAMYFYGAGRDIALVTENRLLAGDIDRPRAVDWYGRIASAYILSSVLYEAAGRLDAAYCDGEVLLYGERLSEWE